MDIRFILISEFLSGTPEHIFEWGGLGMSFKSIWEYTKMVVVVRELKSRAKPLKKYWNHTL